MTTLLRQLAARGIAGTYRAMRQRVEEQVMEWYFEAALGIRTAGHVASDALGYPPSEWGAYDPSRFGDIRRILRALIVRPGVDVFIDLGAGKGRVVIMAARLPFARVVGVERSPALSDIARRNAHAARRHLSCPRIDIVTADAASYQLPDDATVLSFANPFDEAVLDAVLENVRRSLERAPRPLRIVSYGPDPVGPFERRIRLCNWLRVAGEVRLYRANRAWIYQAISGTGDPDQLPAARTGERES